MDLSITYLNLHPPSYRSLISPSLPPPPSHLSLAPIPLLSHLSLPPLPLLSLPPAPSSFVAMHFTCTNIKCISFLNLTTENLSVSLTICLSVCLSPSPSLSLHSFALDPPPLIITLFCRCFLPLKVQTSSSVSVWSRTHEMHTNTYDLVKCSIKHGSVTITALLPKSAVKRRRKSKDILTEYLIKLETP